MNGKLVLICPCTLFPGILICYEFCLEGKLNGTLVYQILIILPSQIPKSKSFEALLYVLLWPLGTFRFLAVWWTHPTTGKLNSKLVLTCLCTLFPVILICYEFGLEGKLNGKIHKFKSGNINFVEFLLNLIWLCFCNFFYRFFTLASFSRGITLFIVKQNNA